MVKRPGLPTVGDVRERMRTAQEGSPPPEPEDVEAVARGSVWIGLLAGLHRHEREMARLGYAVVMVDAAPFSKHHPPLRIIRPDGMRLDDLVDAMRYRDWVRCVRIQANRDLAMIEDCYRDIERLTGDDML